MCGPQIAPADVETVLLSHEAVLDAAVTSRQCAYDGDLLVGVVKTKPGVTVGADRLVAYVESKSSRPVIYRDRGTRGPSNWSGGAMAGRSFSSSMDDNTGHVFLIPRHLSTLLATPDPSPHVV